jgi:branched-chain amino acid transport system substrate-binding protein
MGTHGIWGKASLALVPILALGVALVVGGSVAVAGETLRIGATYPTSGGVAEAASYTIEGIKMAVEEINAKGGVPVQGKNLPIEIFLYDSKCDPTIGVANAEKMINRDQVVAITGDFCSTVALAQKEVSGRNKIIQVTPIAVHPKITEPGYPYMFRTCNTIDMYAFPLVEFIATKLPNVKSLAILAVTDDYGRGAVQIYTELLTKHGVKITGTEYFKRGDTDFYTQITKLLAAKPDGIYLVTNEDAQNIGLLKQLKELGYKGALFGASTYNTDNMVKLGGKELLEGLYMEGPVFELVKEKPEVKEWLQRYAKKYNREGNNFSILGYQSIQLLADVFKRANTLTDKEKIRQAMLKTNLREAMLGYDGDPNFDENGQVHPYMGVTQYQDGKRVAAYQQKGTR